jgi:UV DNA damage endonuclease
MIVRFGYVAMSTIIENASPSRTMTATHFAKIADKEAALRKLTAISAENLHNTLRLLRHNRAHDIALYRFSSKLVPLLSHDYTREWDFFGKLEDDFRAVGDYVKQHRMRTSFHPDHFTDMSTPREEVLRHSIFDLDLHVAMLDAMGLGLEAKCNIHIGGAYGNKEKSGERFVRNFALLRPEVRNRLTLENDDKTFTAAETLAVCEQVGVPIVLDLHHHQVNPGGESAIDLWPRILRTWEGAAPEGTSSFPLDAPLPPKIHVSSPKSAQSPRSHADYVEKGPLLDFLRGIAPFTSRLDIMIEAKSKDAALFKLMEDMRNEEGIHAIDQASIEIG